MDEHKRLPLPSQADRPASSPPSPADSPVSPPVDPTKWLPSDDFIKTQPPNWSYQTILAKYYELFPEYRPPREVVERWQRTQRSEPEQCIAEARAGDPEALIAHLQAYLEGGSPPTRSDIEYLIEILKTQRGDLYRQKRLEVEQYFIVSAVKRCEDELVKQGEKRVREKAVQVVMEQRQISRGTVYRAVEVGERKGWFTDPADPPLRLPGDDDSGSLPSSE